MCKMCHSDSCVVTPEAMSVGLIMSTNMICCIEAMVEWVLHLFNT